MLDGSLRAASRTASILGLFKFILPSHAVSSSWKFNGNWGRGCGCGAMKRVLDRATRSSSSLLSISWIAPACLSTSMSWLCDVSSYIGACLVSSLRAALAPSLSSLVTSISFAPTWMLARNASRLLRLLLLVQTVDPDNLHEALQEYAARARTTHVYVTQSASARKVLYTNCDLLTICVWLK